MSWGRTHPKHCTQIVSYQRAQRYFEERKRVRSERWKENERPLISSTETWFKAVRGGAEDWYDLTCWDQPAIRYFRPLENGDYRVLLCHRTWRNGWLFLYYNKWWRAYDTSVGTTVRVPMNPMTDNAFNSVPECWSASLWFNREDKLILELSEHRNIGVRVGTKEDKEQRKKFKKKMARIIDLLVLRVPYFHENCRVTSRAARPFRGAQQFNPHEYWAVKNAMLDEGVTPGEHELRDEERVIETVVPYGQLLYNALMSKRIAKEDPYALSSAMASLAQHKFYQDSPIEPQRFAQALEQGFVRLAQLDTQSGIKTLPQFPTELPSRYVYLRSK